MSKQLSENEKWINKKVYSNPTGSLAAYFLSSWINTNFNDVNEKLRSSINCIITNLYVAKLEDKDKLLVHKNSNKYKANKAYGFDYFTYNNVIKAIKLLQSKEFITQKNGHFDPESNEGKVTRISPTEKLNTVFNEIGSNFEFSLFMFSAISPPDSFISKNYKKLIILRDSNKQDIKYKPTKYTIRSSERLKKYNSMMKNHQVTIHLDYLTKPIEQSSIEIQVAAVPIDIEWVKSDNIVNIRGTRRLPIREAYTGQDTTIDRDNNKSLRGDSVQTIQPIRSTLIEEREADIQESIQPITNNKNYISLSYKELRVQLHRIFSNGDFKQGGRFYYADYQTLNSKLRSKLLIDNQPVVEVDYSNLHFKMFYHSVNQDPKDDLYLRVYKDDELRKIVKKLANIMINADSYNGALQASRIQIESEHAFDAILEKKKLKVEDILKRIIEAHEPIKAYFYSGQGIFFQKKDSDIADDILTHFTKKDIPVLCIHDSFIVQKKHKDELIKVMKDTYKKHMKFDIDVKVG